MVIALIVVGGVILAHFIQISEWITAPKSESRYVKYSHYQAPPDPEGVRFAQGFTVYNSYTTSGNAYVSPDWMGGLGAGAANALASLYGSRGIAQSATAMQAQMQFDQAHAQYQASQAEWERMYRGMQNRTVEKACTDEPTGV